MKYNKNFIILGGQTQSPGIYMVCKYICIANYKIIHTMHTKVL